MHLQLNPLGGLAGDMFCAALLDAFPDLLSTVREAVACLEMPVPVRIELVEQPGPLSGKRFRVTPEDSPAVHGHPHTRFEEIRRLLDAAPLSAGVRRRALAVFTLLARAEGRVHGIAPEQVSFHEVGSWDSIADIVAAAVLLEALSVDSAATAPLPLGRGRVRSAHGMLPVPAPATALLLEGLPVSDDGVPGERVTPTGAAILKYLQPGPSLDGHGTLRAVGMGFGSRSLEGLPNCLQALCIETPEERTEGFRAERDQVAVLRFELDDQSGEDLALGLDRLRTTAGVLSVTTLQGIGKQGRPTLSVEVLARPERLAAVAEACFRETATIGLRWQPVQRLLLARRPQGVEVEGRSLSVKIVERPDGLDAKVESRDLAAVDGYGQRSRLSRAGISAALGDEHD
jgi:uncharacterized protein (TIGR00299 family) protein